MDDAAGEVIDLELAGEHMRAHAERALYWPARGRLLVADLHLGKGDILRASGIPVPSGGTAHDLARLDALLRDTGARELWILGDFLHGHRHPRVESAWRVLMRAHQGCIASVIAGNHDRSLVPDALGLVHLPDDVRDGPFRFRHAPCDATACDGGDEDNVGDVGAGTSGATRPEHVICGHLHPVVRLPGIAGRHPAFLLDARQTVLPAFSAFTGGCEPGPAAEWIACARGALVARRHRAAGAAGPEARP